jgi:GNAT superfamily N-acetyltransferase
LPPFELESLEEEICECIVFISELRIDPKYRGRGLGSQLLKRTAGMLDVEHCLIALKAFPLAENLGDLAKAEEIEKVQRFYTKHGFQPASGDFMVKDARLCEAVKRRLRRRRVPEGEKERL